MASAAPKRPHPQPPFQPEPGPSKAGFGDASEALSAVATLLDGAAEVDDGPTHDLLAAQARHFFRVSAAVVLGVAEVEGRVEVVAMAPEGDPPFDLLDLARLPALAELTPSAASYLWKDADSSLELSRSLGARGGADGALLLKLPGSEAVRKILVLVDCPPPSSEDVAVAKAFAAAAGACLAQLHLTREAGSQMARQGALVRAATTLNESLDLNRVLVRICEEAVRLLDASGAAIRVGDRKHGVRTQAVYGLPAKAVGSRLLPGEGLTGKVMERDEPMLTNDFHAVGGHPDDHFLADVRSALSVPMRWSGERHGALTVFYRRPFLVTREHLSLLEAFAALAGAACSNASAHSGLARAARTDALTGCLNRAAFQETLSRELERSKRTGKSLSLALLDLDDFKQVNDRHGHQAGDEVLRRVGQALRQAVRPYDHVARYGGDEFAIVALDAEEDEALHVAERAVERVAEALSDYEPGTETGASAGVAALREGERAERLIERADAALLYGKHGGERGKVLGASILPLFGVAATGRLEAELQAALSDSK
jgi:diguanylate cyclase (GGDEF)-like protein